MRENTFLRRSLWALAWLLGCTGLRNPLPAPAAGGVAFLALGDSYTIGEGVPAAERWPVQLAHLARQQRVPLAEPTIVARTGWTTQELQAAVQAVPRHPAPYGLVSLLIGVNNQYRGLPLPSYRAEFQQLLRAAVQLAGHRPGRVLVLSIPDWGQTPAAPAAERARIAAEIDQFNAAARAECQQAGVAFVDITPQTRAATDARQFAPDGLHYSGQHMQGWAEAALPVVQRLLQAK